MGCLYDGLFWSNSDRILRIQIGHFWPELSKEWLSVATSGIAKLGNMRNMNNYLFEVLAGVLEVDLEASGGREHVENMTKT